MLVWHEVTAYFERCWFDDLILVHSSLDLTATKGACLMELPSLTRGYHGGGGRSATLLAESVCFQLVGGGVRDVIGLAGARSFQCDINDVMFRSVSQRRPEGTERGC